MTSADAVHGSLTTYIDFDSPMGTNIYEPVGAAGERLRRTYVHLSKADEKRPSLGRTELIKQKQNNAAGLVCVRA